MEACSGYVAKAVQVIDRIALRRSGFDLGGIWVCIKQRLPFSLALREGFFGSLCLKALTLAYRADHSVNLSVAMTYRALPLLDGFSDLSGVGQVYERLAVFVI